MKDTVLFGSLYREYYTGAFRFARSYVRDDMTAEDLVSDSFFKLWEVMKKEEVKYPQALLITILRHEALDWLKHEQIKQAGIANIASIHSRDLHYRILSLEACNPEELFSKNIQDIIDRTLETLPPLTREIFVLSRYEHLAVKDIAERVNLSSKSVEYHITKSLKALRIALREYLPILFFFIR